VAVRGYNVADGCNDLDGSGGAGYRFALAANRNQRWEVAVGPMSNPGRDRAFLGLTTKRIEALADGIFAIAMTLLVLNLIGVTDDPGGKGLDDMLREDGTKFFNYALAFLLLAVFWIGHHRQFHHIVRSDERLLWINILILMFVALMPFSTALHGEFDDESLAGIIFAGNFLVITLLYLANWVYASRGYRLIDPDTDRELISRESRRCIVVAVASCIAMITSLYVPDWAMLSYLLIPFLLRVASRLHRVEAAA